MGDKIFCFYKPRFLGTFMLFLIKCYGCADIYIHRHAHIYTYIYLSKIERSPDMWTYFYTVISVLSFSFMYINRCNQINKSRIIVEYDKKSALVLQ